MRVNINHLFTSRVTDKLVRRVMAAAARAIPRYRHSEVSIAFVSDATSRRLNRQYRQIDRPTDVLSFSELDVRGKKIFSSTYLGEIVIAIPHTKRQAARYRHPFKEEVATLLIHGWLHLIGHDHQKKNETQAMQRLEKRIYEIFNTSSASR